MRKRQVLGLMGATLMAGVLGYVAHAARAGGIPSPNAMAYTGVLTNPSGAPVANQGVTLSLWNVASGGTSAVCGPYAAVTTASDGSFKVQLDAACVAVVHSTPNLWTQIQVAGQASPMPRTQIGAVPYAVEAARTVVAVDGGLYSVGATYCGSTAPQTCDLLAAVPGAANGYAAGKSLCQTACSSPSAHMCSTDDLIRSIASGAAVPILSAGSWYTAATTSDCCGWQNAACNGPVLNPHGPGSSPSPYFTEANGSSPLPILCCD